MLLSKREFVAGMVKTVDLVVSTVEALSHNAHRDVFCNTKRGDNPAS
jgi:hypothetical protein